MCFKVGKDEIDTVKNLMQMSVILFLSESLGIEFDEVSADTRLLEVMEFDRSKMARLHEFIAEYFDGLQINLYDTPTVGSLLDKIVDSQMQ
jgi:hypothetical protein